LGVFTSYDQVSRILLGFTEFFWFYWMLLGFTGFYRVLPSLVLVLLGFTGCHWVLMGFTKFWLGFTGFYWVLPSFNVFSGFLPGSIVFLTDITSRAYS